MITSKISCQACEQDWYVVACTEETTEDENPAFILTYCPVCSAELEEEDVEACGFGEVEDYARASY